ncbi:MAG: tyrosine-type recombinase/integrase [Rhodobacteraceae bacterium]|nr:tyrosine-type recombinase/integrase [Paracoccaceae bacterium]
MRSETAEFLEAWIDEQGNVDNAPLFPSNRGGPLSLRHGAAMALLHDGVSRTVIALWLGHESVETTQIYLHTDLRLKERAMERTRPSGSDLEGPSRTTPC